MKLHNNNSSYIELRLEGSPNDEGKIRINEFIEVLSIVRICLQKLDKHISKDRKPSAFYRIKDLKSGSASITIEAVPYKPKEAIVILDRFVDSIYAIQEQNKLPEWFKDKELLEDFKGLTSQFKKHISNIEIKKDGKTIQIKKQLETNIEKILGEIVYIGKGSITGHLDIINVHIINLNYFYIYPPIGPTKIRCDFKEELLNKIKQGIKRYVNVIGTLHYRKGEAFPAQIEVEDIQVYPSENELPTLGSLRGMAPDITGKLDSVAFIRKLREADED